MNKYTKGEYVKSKQYPSIGKMLITDINSETNVITVNTELCNDVRYVEHELNPYMFSNFHSEDLGIGKVSELTTFELVSRLRGICFTRNKAYTLYKKCLIDLDTENSKCFLHCWNNCNKRYEVKILREKVVLESCSISVVAKSKEEAKELALSVADSKQYNIIRKDTVYMSFSVE